MHYDVIRTCESNETDLQNAVDVSEALSDPLDNNVTSPLQSLTSEDSLKFPKTLNAHEISIVKHSDRNEKKEPELQVPYSIFFASRF